MWLEHNPGAGLQLGPAEEGPELSRNIGVHPPGEPRPAGPGLSGGAAEEAWAPRCDLIQHPSTQRASLSAPESYIRWQCCSVRPPRCHPLPRVPQHAQGPGQRPRAPPPRQDSGRCPSLRAMSGQEGGTGHWRICLRHDTVSSGAQEHPLLVTRLACLRGE